MNHSIDISFNISYSILTLYQMEYPLCSKCRGKKRIGVRFGMAQWVLAQASLGNAKPTITEDSNFKLRNLKEKLRKVLTMFDF